MMKLSAILLILGALLLAACETDVPRTAPRENPIQRGLRGEGSLIAPQDPGDPYIR